MSISAECNVCGKKYEAPDHLAGKRVRCKQCGNIFELAGGSPDGGPDLNALAEMERSHHSLDATAAGQHTPDDQTGEEGDSPRPLRTGRTNVRFAFPLAKEIDAWAPLVLTLGGLAWLAAFIFKFDSAIPTWLAAIWFAVAVLIYWIVVCPISLGLLHSAGKSIGYQMPINDRRRAFAAYLPPFVLAYVMWATGDGRVVALILGCISGIAVASATVWLLFRLRTNEIAPTTGYSAVGFLIGMALAAGICFGFNIVATNAMIALKKPDVLPTSPFGPGFAWISEADKDRIHAELAAAARPAQAASRPAAEPTAPTPPPGSNSPIVRSSQVAPIPDTFQGVIRPLTDSHFLAVTKQGSETNSITIEVWNTDTWKPAGVHLFDTRAEVNRRRALSPDGKLLARIVSFPSLSVQVSDFVESRASNVYFSDTSLGAPEIVGFLGNSDLLVQWQKETRSALEIVNINTRNRVNIILDLPPFALGESNLTVTRDGKTAAIAAKVSNQPTILIYNLQTAARQAAAQIMSLDSRWPVTPTGLAFSPDNRQLAILFEQSGNGLLQRYEFDSQRNLLTQRFEQVNPAGPIRWGSGRQFSGSAIAWLPNSNGWIIYGQAAFSAPTGQFFADLDIAEAWSCRVLAPDQAEVVSGPSGANSAKQVNILHLDNAKITSMLK